MPTVDNPDGRDPQKRSASKPQPLHVRLYFRPHLVEVVRMVGYAGLPLEDAEQKLNELGKQYGETKIQEAEELVVIERATEPHWVRLTDQVRKLASQILGPPPGHVETDLVAELIAGRQEPARPERPPKPKKSKRKKADAPPAEKRRPDPTRAATVMQQYREAKERHPGMLLLFRMGDFYELFGEDAETAAKTLGLTLTTRDRTIAMAGFPHHSLETYLRKLIQAGHRVAICDEVEMAHSAWEHASSVPDSPATPTSTRRALTPAEWRIVQDHRDGDARCGREWATNGCACALCRVAKRRSRPAG